MLQSIGIPYADSDSDIDTNTDLETTSAAKKNADSTSPGGSACRFAYEKAKRPMMKEVASDVPSEAKTDSLASSDDSHIADGSWTVAGSSKSSALSPTLVVGEDDDEALIDYDCNLDN
ncbi:hypothetical protein DL93DRAFT_2102890 [Clavulina sp. PMI_390]|nr:hypothetical protein DL93DRAFT_2102890 [Clavulina sp. PMI_390]